MKLSAILLVLLAQLSGCASFFCSLQYDLDPVPTGISLPSVEDVVPLSHDDYVVTALTHPTAMTVTRFRAHQEESVASTPSLFPYNLSPSVFRTDRGWWFSRQGNERSVSSVFFVISDDSIQETRVQLPRSDQSVWVPVPGPEPRGVFISVTKEPRTLQIHDVKPSGSRLIGALPWRETGAIRTFINSQWSAETLSDGRIAVMTTGEAGDEGTINVHVFGGAELHVALPCTVSVSHPIGTAVDEAGRLAIAGLAKDGRVVAMIAEIDALQSARCRVLSPPGETAARPPFGTPSVEWTGQAFVAAWIRSDGKVRASELRNLDSAPLVVDIGSDANVDHPLRQLVHRTADEVVFVWRTRGGEIVERSMPHDVIGHTVAMDLLRRVCAAFDRMRSTSSATAR